METEIVNGTLQRKLSFDPKSLELAEHFYPSHRGTVTLDKLAQDIQDVIESNGCKHNPDNPCECWTHLGSYAACVNFRLLTINEREGEAESCSPKE